MKNVLACYGRYGNIMYNHLPTIVVHRLQIGAPPSSQVAEVQEQLSQHDLEAVVLTTKYQEEETAGTAEATTDWIMLSTWRFAWASRWYIAASEKAQSPSLLSTTSWQRWAMRRPLGASCWRRNPSESAA